MSRGVAWLHARLNRLGCERCRSAVRWVLAAPTTRVTWLVSVVMLGGALVFVIASLTGVTNHTATESRDTKALATSTQALVLRIADLEQRQRASDAAGLVQRRQANQERLTRDERNAALSKQVAVVAKARADEAASSALVVARLARANRLAVRSVVTDERHIADLTLRVKRSSAASARRICVNVSSLTKIVLASLRSSLATIGKPGTPGAEFYALFPADLAKEKAVLRGEIKRFGALRCLA